MGAAPLSLADTALLIALPLDKAAFARRVLESDWLGKFRDLPEYWQQEYAPVVAEPVLEMLGQAHTLGAAIRTEANLNDLWETTAHCRTVIVFAHWKGPEVAWSDLAPGATRAQLLERASAAGTSLARWLHARLQAPAERLGLEEVLNEALECKLSSGSDPGEVVLEDAVTRATARREELDQLFTGLLQPGNLLELYDGLHDKYTVEAAIAPGFTGVLDLSACNSAILAAFIGGRRGHALRTVHFPNVVEFLWAAQCVKGTLRLVSTGAFDYQEARLAVTEILNQEIRRAGARR